MLVINFLLFLYLLCSYCFTFSLSSLVRIFLIVMSSLTSSLVLYLVLGFSWYLLLFVLVYVGGVYILFVYISLMVPNVGLTVHPFNNLFNYFNLFMLFLFCLSLNVCVGGVIYDNSVYLCSSFEYLVYLFFCLVLLLGLVLVNFIVCGLSSCLR